MLKYEDIVDAEKELRKEGWLPSKQPDAIKKGSKTHGKLFNPSKRYQITIGISEFGTQNAHVVPINEFDQEDWICPRCHQCMQDTILYKNKKVACEKCGLELWKENHFGKSI